MVADSSEAPRIAAFLPLLTTFPHQILIPHLLLQVEGRGVLLYSQVGSYAPLINHLINVLLHYLLHIS